MSQKAKCGPGIRIDSCLVHLGDSLRHVLTALDGAGTEIILVADPFNSLVGILTDGDVRRAILNGANLEMPLDGYVQRHFTSVYPGAGRAEVLDIMQARQISQVPIVDHSGKVVGLHTLHGILGELERPNWAVVMAGGRGERLKPYTNDLPKPMLKVAGRPILERIVLHLVGQGFRAILISVNYMSEVIERHFEDGSAFGCEIQYLREKEPLGTGGALALLPAQPEHPILVLNGDLLTQFDASGMLDFHAEGGYAATVGCYEYVHTIPYGVLDLSQDRVTEMREKPRETWTVNAGIYVLEPALVTRVPKDAYFPLPALVEECLARNERVGAYRIAGDWIDVGHHEELRRARGEEERA
jgi:dTDP-glucose pyrophosphorylase/CBS domain-containing protein